jgi:DNA-binding transcriptional LysR family regulator
LANGWELDLAIGYDGLISVNSFFPMVEQLSKVSKTRIRLQEEILAGGWEALTQGRVDILIAPDTESLPRDIKSEKIGKVTMIWVAAPDHYVHKRAGSFDEDAREKYKIIAIADTAREQPSVTINILQKQPRLTVSNFDAKYQALLEGMGIGTMPLERANTMIAQGKLKAIEGAAARELNVVMAWRRNKIGEAKSWCIQYMKKNWKG